MPAGEIGPARGARPLCRPAFVRHRNILYWNNYSYNKKRVDTGFPLKMTCINVSSRSVFTNPGW